MLNLQLYNGIARNVFRNDELGQEIMQIALPTALALTADPIASLIDTAFIGHIGQCLLFVFIFMYCSKLVLSVCYNVDLCLSCGILLKDDVMHERRLVFMMPPTGKQIYNFLPSISQFQNLIIVKIVALDLGN